MSKLIALEWDQQEARVVVAKTTGQRVAAERALSIDLTAAGSDASPETPAECLARHLRAHKISKADVSITIGRSGTELRLLEVPYAPPAELPQLVKFQALRSFAAMNEDWILDFITLGEVHENKPMSILAAAISPQLMEQVKTACEKASLTPKRLQLRPFSLATLICRTLPSEAVRLCLDPIGDEIDMIVLVGAEIDMVRTVRLARNDEGQFVTKQLMAEIRRTLVAFGNQPHGLQVQQIVMCGGEDELALANEIKTEIGIDTTILDPFQGLDAKASVLADVGNQRSRYAALLGSLLDPITEDNSTIDFMNPRKPPVAVAERRRNALIGVVVATALLAIIGLLVFQVYLKGAKVNSLQNEVSARNTGHKENLKRISDMDQVNGFANTTRLNWLAELNELGSELPRDGLVLDSLNCRLDESTGTIQFSGRAADTEIINKVENDLRDPRHVVRSRGTAPNDDRELQWVFGETITIDFPTDEDEAGPTPDNVD